MGDELRRLVRLMQSSLITYPEALREFKRAWVIEALKNNRGNNCRTAAGLGLHRNTLSRLTTELGIDLNVIRKASQ